jgi:seryl-tRNA synthetase
MIDLVLLRENPQHIASEIKKKDPLFAAEKLVELDEQLRTLRVKVEELRHKKNQLAQQAKAGLTQEMREQSIEVGKALKASEAILHDVEKAFNDLYLHCPNVPDTEIPLGGKESNKVVAVYGEKPTFNFAIKNHVELGEALGWIDFKVAAQMAASNFVLYKGQAVQLMYALTMFMLQHNKKHGYSMVLPPYLVNAQSLENASNFPKFKDQVYAASDDLFLIPTSEASLANMYRDTIFTSQELPIRMTSWTSCFRREAGTYGATERGLIRIHQFEKVELYTYCVPEESPAELEKMLTCATELLQQLGLHYRVSLLAAQDCSFPSAKTYDIEVWMPGQNAYYEVSSCSNCTDFQARRAAVRYRKAMNEKTQFVHTLNGSSLALPRLMVALMETYQQPDGTIIIPDVLKKFWI